MESLVSCRLPKCSIKRRLRKEMLGQLYVGWRTEGWYSSEQSQETLVINLLMDLQNHFPSPPPPPNNLTVRDNSGSLFLPGSVNWPPWLLQQMHYHVDLKFKDRLLSFLQNLCFWHGVYPTRGKKKRYLVPELPGDNIVCPDLGTQLAEILDKSIRRK